MGSRSQNTEMYAKILSGYVLILYCMTCFIVLYLIYVILLCMSV